MRELVLVLFAISGHLTGILELQFLDLTLILGAIMVGDLLSNALLGNFHIPSKSKHFLWALVTFVLWIFVTGAYSSSTSYITSKWLSLLCVLVGLTYVVGNHSRLNLDRIVAWHMVYCLYLVFNYYLILWAEGSLTSIIFTARTAGLSDYLTSSTYLCLGVIMLYERGKAWHTLLAAAIVLPILVFLGARGPVLILLAGYGFILFRKNLLRLCGVATVLLLCLQMFDINNTLLHQRLQSALSGNDDSLGERFVYFESAWGAIQSTPLLGVGFGGFGMFHRDVDERCYPHNIILEIWAELGLVGIVIFGGTCLFAARQIRSNKTYTLLLVFTLLQLMKSSSFVDSKYLFIFVGLLFTTAHEEERLNRRLRLW